MKITQGLLVEAIEVLEPKLKISREAGAKVPLTTLLDAAAISGFLKSVKPHSGGAGSGAVYDQASLYVAAAITEIRNNGSLTFGVEYNWGAFP